jgi:hypothetical protein
MVSVPFCLPFSFESANIAKVGSRNKVYFGYAETGFTREIMKPAGRNAAVEK